MSICSTGGARRGRAVSNPIGVPPKQAWEMLGCSNSTGYELLAAGELDSYTVGRARRVTVASIRRYVARRLTRRCGRPAGAEAQT
jgi:excisionase family DNA binding protein